MILGIFDFSLLGIVRLLLYVAIGTVVGVYMSMYITPKNRILYCRERDGRGEEQKIVEEDHGFIKTNMDKQFIKKGRAYEFVARMGRKITTYFGKEGTAYTWSLEGFKNGKQVEHIFETLGDAVRLMWGKKFFATVPLKQREKLENNKILVTVDLEPGLTPEGYKPISEKDISDEGDKRFLGLWARAAEGVVKTPILQIFALLGAGGLLVTLVYLFFGFIQLAKVG